MAGTHVLILSSGGLRSLVATALMAQDADRPRLMLLHVVDGRDNAVTRLEFVRRQADHFRITRIGELDLTHLYGQGLGPDGEPIGTLVNPQILLAAITQARLGQCERVIWPVSCNVDVKTIASAMERMLLCEHLADLEAVPMPSLVAPLLELSDQQIIELGGQLDVPWALAWSCLRQGDQPCRACPACKRRQLAFEKSGMVDPVVDQGVRIGGAH